MSLIEVLVSLFILSLLLLSLNALQLVTLKQTQAIYYFNIANQRIEQWLNVPNKESYFDEWQEENKHYLPQPVSSLSQGNMVLTWGGMQEECTHSIIEKSGCIILPL